MREETREVKERKVRTKKNKKLVSWQIIGRKLRLQKKTTNSLPERTVVLLFLRDSCLINGNHN